MNITTSKLWSKLHPIQRGIIALTADMSMNSATYSDPLINEPGAVARVLEGIQRCAGSEQLAYPGRFGLQLKNVLESFIATQEEVDDLLLFETLFIFMRSLSPSQLAPPA